MLTVTSFPVPNRLKTLAVPPETFFVAGNLKSLAKRPSIAVVGSRKATSYGRIVTDKLVRYLAARGVVIVSGLAYGIDSFAHQAALDGGGQTIAVLPGDLKRIYPSAHAGLAKEIVLKGGALVSEYETSPMPMAHQFIARNRLIAGLADAVLIPEAAIKSGSLHTANFALEQGKAVLAVPGPITSSISEGCNNLIKAGAVPITKPEDILHAMGWQDGEEDLAPMGSNEPEQLILDFLQEGITDGLELQARSELDPAVFNQHLTMLELNGKIRPLGGNHWTLQ